VVFGIAAASGNDSWRSVFKAAAAEVKVEKLQHFDEISTVNPIIIAEGPESQSREEAESKADISNPTGIYRKFRE
jgi:hypothetical protein